MKTLNIQLLYLWITFSQIENLYGSEEEYTDYIELLTLPRSLPVTFSQIYERGFPVSYLGSKLFPIILPTLKESEEVAYNLDYNLAMDTKHLEETCKYLNSRFQECISRWKTVKSRIDLIDNADRELLENPLSKPIYLPKRTDMVLQDLFLKCFHLMNSNNTFDKFYRALICPNPCKRKSFEDSLHKTQQRNNAFFTNLREYTNKPEFRKLPCQIFGAKTHVCKSQSEEDEAYGYIDDSSFKCNCLNSKSEMQLNTFWNDENKECFWDVDWLAASYRMIFSVNENLTPRITEEKFISQKMTFDRITLGSIKCSENGTSDFSYLYYDDPLLRNSQNRFGYNCLCKNGITGVLCDELVNTCSSSDNFINGDTLCLTSIGGVCVPYDEEMKVSNFFRCSRCPPGREKLIISEGPNKGLDNCLKYKVNCDSNSTECIHSFAFDRKKEIEGKLFISKKFCDREFSGKNCDIHIRPSTWSEWTSWSLCDPPVNPANIFIPRVRTRKRACFERGGECTEGTKEIQQRICVPRPEQRFNRLIYEEGDTKFTETYLRHFERKNTGFELHTLSFLQSCLWKTKDTFNELKNSLKDIIIWICFAMTVISFTSVIRIIIVVFMVKLEVHSRLSSVASSVRSSITSFRSRLSLADLRR